MDTVAAKTNHPQLTEKRQPAFVCMVAVFMPVYKKNKGYIKCLVLN